MPVAHEEAELTLIRTPLVLRVLLPRLPAIRARSPPSRLSSLLFRQLQSLRLFLHPPPAATRLALPAPLAQVELTLTVAQLAATAPMVVRRQLRSLPSWAPPLMLDTMRRCCSASQLPCSVLSSYSRHKVVSSNTVAFYTVLAVAIRHTSVVG